MVTCEVESDPTDVTFKWFYNNSSETTEVRSFVSTGTRSVLKYTPQSRFSHGTLFCIAENNIGVQAKPCMFNLKLVVPTADQRSVASSKSVLQSDVSGQEEIRSQSKALADSDSSTHADQESSKKSKSNKTRTGFSRLTEDSFLLTVIIGSAIATLTLMVMAIKFVHCPAVSRGKDGKEKNDSSSSNSSVTISPSSHPLHASSDRSSSIGNKVSETSILRNRDNRPPDTSSSSTTAAVLTGSSSSLHLVDHHPQQTQIQDHVLYSQIEDHSHPQPPHYQSNKCLRANHAVIYSDLRIGSPDYQTAYKQVQDQRYSQTVSRTSHPRVTFNDYLTQQQLPHQQQQQRYQQNQISSLCSSGQTLCVKYSHNNMSPRMIADPDDPYDHYTGRQQFSPMMPAYDPYHRTSGSQASSSPSTSLTSNSGIIPVLPRVTTIAAPAVNSTSSISSGNRSNTPSTANVSQCSHVVLPLTVVPEFDGWNGRNDDVVYKVTSFAGEMIMTCMWCLTEINVSTQWLMKSYSTNYHSSPGLFDWVRRQDVAPCTGRRWQEKSVDKLLSVREVRMALHERWTGVDLGESTTGSLRESSIRHQFIDHGKSPVNPIFLYFDIFRVRIK